MSEHSDAMKSSAIRCWNCGYPLESDDEICPNCGIGLLNAYRKQSREDLCAQCGQPFTVEMKDVHSEWTICPVCRDKMLRRRKSESERRRVHREKQEHSDRAGLRSQRAAVRFEVARCFVRVSRIGLTAVLLRRSKPRMGPLVDLSMTGLQCVSEGTFEAGDPVSISLLVPAFNEPLALKGMIKWAEPEGKEQTRIGVHFDQTDEKTRTHLAALEKHQALRDAAYLKEEKQATREIPKPDLNAPPPGERPADF